MFNLNRNVYVIALVMAMSFTVISMTVLITGLLGASLAPDPKMATLPAAMLIVGTAFATIPAALWMQRIGRKRGMATGILLALIGIGLAYYAAITGKFWFLIVGMLCIGFNAAFTQQGRFIILENSDNEQRQADGLTLALMANLIAAVVGPWLGTLGKDVIQSHSGFAGSFLLAGAALIVALLVLSTFRDIPSEINTSSNTGRSLLVIVRQPIFLMAMGSAAVGYGVMSLIMTATPISMHHVSGHSIGHTRLVIQSHIVAMFLPSLFSGYLVKRGLRQSLIIFGLVIYLGVLAIGLQGVGFIHYWWALVLLGLGWNLLFLTSTAMLPRAYENEERFKAQALNDFLIFTVQAIAAFGAGWLLFNVGWESILWIGAGLSGLWLIVFGLLSFTHKSNT